MNNASYTVNRTLPLSAVAEARTVVGLTVRDITPNGFGDWLNQRRDDFEHFFPVSTGVAKNSLFSVISNGVKSQRDAWVWNFSKRELISNVGRTIDVFNEKSKLLDGSAPPVDQVSWSRRMSRLASIGKSFSLNRDQVRVAFYRPYTALHTCGGGRCSGWVSPPPMRSMRSR
ncbi:type ISP restriction/modification enzyme [Rudaeicoccus suwonensis]|uniref:type ISP restriction/modification enzyme n=1 Tax=Rudaeicoccus suwonensis TaxID=657409 RepID=UPI001476B55B